MYELLFVYEILKIKLFDVFPQKPQLWETTI